MRNTRANISVGKDSFQGKRGCRRGTQKRAAPPISTAVLGQLRAVGSPLTCLQVPREEEMMLGDKSSLPRDNPPLLS